MNDSTTDQAIILDDGGDPMDCDCCEAFATVLTDQLALFCANHYADHLMRLEIQDQADALTDWLSDMLDARYHAHQEEVAA